MIVVYLEIEPRQGRHICHLFQDCRVLADKAFEPRRVDDPERLIPICKGCRTGSSVPGHPNERSL